MNPIRHRAPIFVFALLALIGAGIISREALSNFFQPSSLAAQPSPGAVRSKGQSKEPGATAKARISQSYGKSPMLFEANREQTDARVKFIARGSGYSLFLTDNEAVLRMRHEVADVYQTGFTNPQSRFPIPDSRLPIIQSAILRMKLVGANRKPRVRGAEQLQTTSNYFIGNDPDKWRTNVANFAKVKYEAVYPGVDLVWYGNQGRLEHDFIVAPGADPKRIVLSFAGADAMTIDDDGALVLRVDGEEVRLLKPVAWQEADGKRRDIACDYRAAKKDQIGFRLGDYDAKLPLVIDPVLIYSTYIGGAGFDYGLNIAVDSEGAAYITGQTDSADFPGPSQIQSAKGASSEAYVLKINPAGDTVVFSTWLGGNGADSGSGVGVDAGGNVYVTGFTSSSNFPLQNPLQSSRKGSSDAFVVKINPSGSALLYSTYLGGSGADSTSASAVDGAGNVYLTGSTDSTDFPLVGAFQPAKKGSGAYASDNAGDNWNEIGNGLNGADVNDLVVDPGNPSTLYAGTDRGVFKSADKGASWNQLGGAQFVRNINQVIVDPVAPNILYVVSFSQFFKSVDGGANWTAKPISLVRTAAIDPATTTTIYAGTLNGLLKSMNGGDSWAPVAIFPIGGGGTIGQVDAIAVDPITPATVYVGANRGLYKTVNGGANWTFAGNGLVPPFSGSVRFSRIAISRSNPMTIYAMIGDSAVFKTTNGGGNWVQLTAPQLGFGFSQNPLPLVVAPNNSDVIYLGSRASSVYKTTDGGSTWNAINNGLNATEIRAIAIDRDSPNTVYAGADSGLEAFVAKINPAGSSIVYSSYIGGGASESGAGIAVDSIGAAYVAGTTNSQDFPVVNALQAAIGGQTDAFVAKISASGSAVLWATYLGGSNPDYADGVAVNASGNVFVAGLTLSNNFPTARAFQTSLKGQQDAFVARFSGDGSKLDFSTYLGGSQIESAFAIAVDPVGNCYITGVTESPDFPVVSAPQPNRGGDPTFISNPDAFVTKFSADGSSLLYSTYLGGANYDQGYGIAVDPAGSAYVTGVAFSNDFPTTPNPIRRAGPNDAFVAKLGISADLAVSLADLPDPVMVNNQLTYTLIVSNNGPDPATGVTVTDALPNGVSLVSATPTQGSCLGSGLLSCEIGNLAPNTRAGITIVVTPSSAGPIINSVNASSATPDLNLANNAASQATKVSTLPSIYGSVTTPGAGFNGVNVALTGGQRPPAVTANNGLYQFSELAAGGDYTVTPSLPGYVFNPARRSYTNLNSDQRADFSAVACVFSISPSGQPFPATGGVGSVTITSPDAQCPWTARSNAPWIKITSAAGGAGNGTVTFSVDPTVGSRSGSIAIAGNTFAVFQEFNPCAAASFQTTPRFQLPENNYNPNFLVGDFNKDGLQDLVISTTSSGPTVLFFPARVDGSYGEPKPVLNLPGGNGFSLSIRAADLNPDGNLDLLVAGVDERIRVINGDGAGNFSPPRAFDAGMFTIAAAAGDFNGDNRTDLIAGFTTNPFGAILLNDGAGGFGPAVKLPEGNSPFPPSQVEALHLDGDGKLDLLFRSGPEIQIYKGDGAGGFTPQPLFPLPFTQANGIGDFNGDSRPDLFFLGAGSLQGEILVSLNNGSGSFGSPVRTPLGFGFNFGEVTAVTDDFNLDGRADIVIRGTGVTLLTSAGDGRFNAPITFLSTISSSMKTGDYNRDGRPDILSLNNNGRLTILTSQGAGFNAPRGFSVAPMGAPITAGAVEASDLNDDGVIDLAVAATNFVGALLMFGDGRGEFGPAIAVGGGDVTSGGSRALTIRDFNRDGKPDLAALNSDTQNIIILIGDGRGGFSRSATLNIGGNALALAAADFNGDGNLDLVAKGQSGGLALFIGNGQGGFTPTASGIGGNLAFFTFTAGDFNGDGKADLALSDDFQIQPSEGFKLTVLPGDGVGGFGAPVDLMSTSRAAAIRSADLNLDGRDDIVFTASEGSRLFVALSNAGGRFASPVGYQTNGAGGGAVIVSDINGDGKPDLIYTNQTASGTISILYGKGDGDFNTAVTLPVFDSPALIAAGDFDEDGATDLAITRGNSSLIGSVLNKASCVPSGAAVPASAASFAKYRAAPESIVSLFGVNLAPMTESASSLPLPTILAGASVKIKDSADMERSSPLFFVSPQQINLLIPTGTAPGVALITVTNRANTVATGTVSITPVSPGIFTADSSGQGLAAALVLRAKADGSQVYEPILRFDPAANKFVAIPIDLGVPSDQVFLVMFGTGVRNNSGLANVKVKIGGGDSFVQFAGSQGPLGGLDQINALLSRSLMGAGEVDVLVTVDGRASNTVRINVR